jgi:hypothetical protein
MPSLVTTFYHFVKRMNADVSHSWSHDRTYVGIRLAGLFNRLEHALLGDVVWNWVKVDEKSITLERNI